MRATAWQWGIRGAVLLILLLAALPNLQLATNPHHLDTARAFLSGSVWIDQPTNTHDLGRVDGRWFAPFPPLPAVIAMPCVLLAPAPSACFNLLLLAAALAAVWQAWRLGECWGGPVAGTWAAVAMGLGSGLWVATAIHDTYHSAHLLAVPLTLGALNAVSARRPRSFTSGLLLGLAALARQATVMAAPAVALMSVHRSRMRSLLAIVVGVALPMTVYLGLNQVRFGNPLQTGYGRVEHHQELQADVAAHGAFSLHYVGRNLRLMASGTPKIVSVAPWIVPDPRGMAVLLVSPWLLLALLPVLWPDRPGARTQALLCWAAAALVSLPHLLYVNTGWVHFGYRFALDYLPFLLFAAVLGVRRLRPAAAVPLLAFAVLVNAWGYYCLLTWQRWSPYLGR